MKKLALSLVVGFAFLAGACASDGNKREINEAKEKRIAKDGLPDWVSEPEVGLPKGAIAHTGQSSLASMDVELAKTEAETIARGGVAEKLNVKVTKVVERSAEAMRDLSGGKPVGETTLRTMQQDRVNQSMVGIRYEYHYHPDRVEPEVIYVRATLDVDDAEMSRKLMDQVVDAAKAEGLEVKHEDAMTRLDKVRREYLAEEGR
jgi:hypothetical protein